MAGGLLSCETRLLVEDCRRLHAAVAISAKSTRYVHRGLGEWEPSGDPGLWLDVRGLPREIRSALAPRVAPQDPAAVRRKRRGPLQRCLASKHGTGDPGLWLDVRGLPREIRSALAPRVAPQD